MARPGKIGCLAIIIGSNKDAVRTVGGADAGGDPFSGIDAHGERRAEPCGIIRSLRIEAELVALFLGQRQAYQASAVFCHKVYQLRGRKLCGADQIAFILTILIIDQNDHLTGF